MITQQFTLRELFALSLLVGSAIAALKLGGFAASAFLGIAFLSVCAVAIHATVNPDKRPFSMGFLIPMGLYGCILLSSGGIELGTFGRLATTRLLRVVHTQLVQNVWISSTDGHTYPVDQPLPDERKAELAGGQMQMAKVPELRTFLICGHTALAILLGYIGGKYAAILRRRRESAGLGTSD